MKVFIKLAHPHGSVSRQVEIDNDNLHSLKKKLLKILNSLDSYEGVSLFSTLPVDKKIVIELGEEGLKNSPYNGGEKLAKFIERIKSIPNNEVEFPIEMFGRNEVSTSIYIPVVKIVVA